MCGKPKAPPPPPEPAWKKASATDSANRGAEPDKAVDLAKRVSATNTPGGTLGGAPATGAAPTTASVLGG